MVNLEVYREYLGEPQKVGDLTEGAEGVQVFLYDPVYLKTSSQPLSISLPLREEPYTPEQFSGFFEGLVPEGRLRTELARRFHLSPSDYLGILSHLNYESLGAVMFVNPHAPRLSIDEQHYAKLSAKTLLDLVDFPVRTSADLADRGRFSLAGAQAKIGIYLEEPDKPQLFDNLPSSYLPEGSAPSTHILKVPDEDFRDIPFNELFCLLLASECGFDAARAGVYRVEGKSVFVSRRYDRLITDESSLIDGKRRPFRLHQEDFCQALGAPSYRKYEIEATDNYVALIARLFERVSADVVRDKLAFARQIVFDYLIGNCDNHLKNFALLSSPDWTARRLAPAYDIVCTTILGYSREMGISIGDTRNIDDISPNDWVLFAQDLGLPITIFKTLQLEVAERFEAAQNSICQRLSEQGAKNVTQDIIADAKHRLKRLKALS